MILAGVELLELYRKDFSSGIAVSIADLRMVVYALQVALEECYAEKEESLLYPVLRSLGDSPSEVDDLIDTNREERRKSHEEILALRLCIDEYERDQGKFGLLSFRLNDVISRATGDRATGDDQILTFAESKLDSHSQRDLLQRAQELDRSRGVDHLKKIRQILNNLRAARGLPFAS